MPKWAKFIIGVLLLPLCVGVAKALWLLLPQTGKADTTWVAIAAGAACWFVIYLMLPKPMWIYVFGHELTHAVWAWMFGGKVKKFKASSSGGHVVVTKSNFLIALAPYFFPLYAFMALGIFGIGHLAWNWTPYRVWLHLALGLTYAFHVTLTGHILKTQQSDITENGYVFSAVIIFLGNSLVLLIGVPLLTGQVGLVTVFRSVAQETLQVLWWLGALMRR